MPSTTFLPRNLLPLSTIPSSLSLSGHCVSESEIEREREREREKKQREDSGNSVNKKENRTQHI
jgi:hypothetical protein